MSIPDENAVFCYEDVRDRCLGNVELIERVLTIFAEGTSSDMEALKSAIEDGDLTQTAKTAHRIKGSAANSAAYRMSAYAGKIERSAKDNDASPLSALYADLTVSFEDFLVARQALPASSSQESL